MTDADPHLRTQVAASIDRLFISGHLGVPDMPPVYILPAMKAVAAAGVAMTVGKPAAAEAELLAARKLLNRALRIVRQSKQDSSRRRDGHGVKGQGAGPGPDGDGGSPVDTSTSNPPTRHPGEGRGPLEGETGR